MGSFTVTHLAADLGIHRVVLWASIPMVSFLRDLSGSSSTQVLVLQASEDLLLDMMIPDKAKQEALTKQYYQLLPSSTTTRTIPGGTHSGFASYVSSFAPEVNLIPREEQHARAVDWTVEFLRQNYCDDVVSGTIRNTF
jgi:hypothetical protein